VPGDDVEDLLPALEPAGLRPPGGEADDALLQQLAAVAGVERHPHRGCADLVPRRDVVCMDDGLRHRGH
jgi:hypothetical protein